MISKKLEKELADAVAKEFNGFVEKMLEKCIEDGLRGKVITLAIEKLIEREVDKLLKK